MKDWLFIPKLLLWEAFARNYTLKNRKSALIFAAVFFFSVFIFPFLALGATFMEDSRDKAVALRLLLIAISFGGGGMLLGFNISTSFREFERKGADGEVQYWRYCSTQIVPKLQCSLLLRDHLWGFVISASLAVMLLGALIETPSEHLTSAITSALNTGLWLSFFFLLGAVAGKRAALAQESKKRFRTYALAIVLGFFSIDVILALYLINWIKPELIDSHLAPILYYYDDSILADFLPIVSVILRIGISILLALKLLKYTDVWGQTAAGKIFFLSKLGLFTSRRRNLLYWEWARISRQFGKALWDSLDVLITALLLIILGMVLVEEPYILPLAYILILYTSFRTANNYAIRFGLARSDLTVLFRPLTGWRDIVISRLLAVCGFVLAWSLGIALICSVFLAISIFTAVGYALCTAVPFALSALGLSFYFVDLQPSSGRKMRSAGSFVMAALYVLLGSGVIWVYLWPSGAGGIILILGFFFSLAGIMTILLGTNRLTNMDF